MKKMIILLVAVLSMGAASAKTVKKVINVSGNCGTCENRIESTAKSINGVASANWNIKSKKLAVVFDDKKSNIKKIETKLASVGHDTQDVKATSKVYNSLPSCCLYRK